MIIIVSVLVSFCIFAIVLTILLKVRTPRYRIQAQQVKSILEMVLCGQATSNDWNLFLAFEIRDNPYLDTIRKRCVEIDESEFRDPGTKTYLFTAKGLEQLRELLNELTVYIEKEVDQEND
ncbi:hypothetical protein [Sessilibacter corallicola]|uniref:hypothetical protein n=1 Tax=Sessilibacter corallicola TaxID=2904075 RepID=UPI001E3DE0D2|nr:hypothetical protein [Sessilibacter corallicola]MCE2028249.1 hypothetical protein [Sessilibacter corallicola]